MKCKEFFYEQNDGSFLYFFIALKDFVGYSFDSFLGYEMLGERGSIIKAIFLNPKVIIGLVLTYLTLTYEEGHCFDVFYEPTTYRNLAIGSAIYICFFGLVYTEGMKKLDILETLKSIVVTMAIIFLVWFVSLSLVVNYQEGGNSYSALLRRRFQQNKTTNTDIVDALENADLESGKKYKVTPGENGNIVIEVLDN